MAADFNGDGRTDLAVADPGLNEVSILLGNGDGTFDSLPPIPVPGGPYALVAGDFTGNGRIDLAVADHELEHASPSCWVTATGHSTTAAADPAGPRPTITPSPTRSWRATSPATAISTWPSPTPVTDDVTVLLGNGDGTFQRSAADLAWRAVRPRTLSLVAGDFRNNGHTDLAVASTDYF